MRVIKFNLNGSTAFFKKPDVNSCIYFTYSNIHKISVLGILGSILGMKGYNQQQNSAFPEFYEKLESFKISIVPKNLSVTKKIQVFNNSVGYASFEQGGNLIVKEQWLENPDWDIYILENENIELFNELENRLKKYQFHYLPYLGKNDHIANIKDVQCFESLKSDSKTLKIEGLLTRDLIREIVKPRRSDENFFKYEERLPIKLEKVTNQYIFDKKIHTNYEVELLSNDDIYNCNNLNLYFD
ncbi:MAG: type I-B CRISPR-associated protein Cas5b [Cetobacterium sp.]